MNYIPTTAAETGSYLCTWDRQSFVASKYRFSDSADMRDALTPEYLFGDEENYHWLPREFRKGLYFLLDDGWDTPPHTNPNSHIVRTVQWILIPINSDRLAKHPQNGLLH